MKRILSLLLSIVFLSGCSVSKTTIPQADTATPEVELSFLLTDDAPSALEQAADAYHNLHPQVTFNFIRYPDDENYRVHLLKKLHTDPPTVFSIHGESDLSYFLENAQPLPVAVTPLTESFSSDGVVYALPITLYGCGIIYNSRLLSVMGIDPASFATLDGLQESISSINAVAASYGIEKAVCTGTDLEEISITNGVQQNPDAVPAFSPTIQTVLSLVGNGPLDDPATMLSNRTAVLYFGSSKIISSIEEIRPDIADDFAFAPLPLLENPKWIETSDMVVVNKEATDGQKKALQQFFNWLFTEYGHFPLTPYTTAPSSSLEESLLSHCQTNDFVRGQGSRAPAGFQDDFSVQSELLRTGAIGWGDYLTRLTECWQSGKGLE